MCRAFFIIVYSPLIFTPCLSVSYIAKGVLVAPVPAIPGLHVYSDITHTISFPGAHLCPRPSAYLGGAPIDGGFELDVGPTPWEALTRFSTTLPTRVELSWPCAVHGPDKAKYALHESSEHPQDSERL